VTATEIPDAHEVEANRRTVPRQPAGRLSRGQIADRLTEMADLLEAQAADRFRVRAYRQGAATVRAMGEDPALILARDGLKGLTDLQNIGPSLARAIDEMAETGRWMQLERLRGDTEPERLFQVLPGVGPETARALHDHLHVDTLEALEIAAHDGRRERRRRSAPRWRRCWRGAGAVGTKTTRNRRSRSCSRLMRRIAVRRRQAACAALHRGASTRMARRGCRSCMSIVTAGR
jgi:hypothetical protein